MNYDFCTLWDRHKEWSQATFGPAQRTEGILQHITKEIEEVRQAPDDIEEWADLLLLVMDGARRRGGFGPTALLKAASAKLEKNIKRKWVDWRSLPPDVPSEHVRVEE